MFRLAYPLLAVLLLALRAVADPAAGAPWQSEKWTDAPLLVWASPGRDGQFADPASWLIDGKPAGRAPDRTTDVLLPAADTEYSVRHVAGEFRHLTIERNARLLGSHNGGEAQCWGNIDVRAGGRIHFVSFVGDKNTFFRLADGEWVNPGARANYKMTGPGCDYYANADHASSHITHKLQICKYQGASVEFIGNMGVSDEIQVQAGRLIVAGELRWNGVSGKGALEVFDGATVELQSGGVLAPFLSDNLVQVFNVNLYKGATLQAGSPERPLVSDAFLLIGYTRGDPDDGKSGLYAAEGSRLRVYTRDPAHARLVISSVTSRAGAMDGIGRKVGDPDRPATANAGIVLHLAGETDLGAVTLDYVRTGGLRLANPSAPALDSLVLGPHCAGPLPVLQHAMTVDPNGRYDTRRANRAWVLNRSRATMEEYLAQNYRPRIDLSRPATGRWSATLSSKMGESIRYTLDGSEPSESSPLYASPVDVPEGATIRARAFRAGREPSEIAEAVTR